ncbi:MAG: YraN family protein [Solirubrobacterales bacterium]
MSVSRQRLGARAEQFAAEDLEASGWEILARNVRTRHGEIDIIARERHALVFVEVKAGRLGTSVGPERPTLAVGLQKQRRIRRLAAAYLAGCPPLPRFAEIRFDVIGLSFAAGGELAGIEHLRNAF